MPSNAAELALRCGWCDVSRGSGEAVYQRSRGTPLALWGRCSSFHAQHSVIKNTRHASVLVSGTARTAVLRVHAATNNLDRTVACKHCSDHVRSVAASSSGGVERLSEERRQRSSAPAHTAWACDTCQRHAGTTLEHHRHPLRELCAHLPALLPPRLFGIFASAKSTCCRTMGSYFMNASLC